MVKSRIIELSQPIHSPSFIPTVSGKIRTSGEPRNLKLSRRQSPRESLQSGFLGNSQWIQNLTAAFALLAVATAQAALPEPQRLTWEECVRRASTDNPEIKAAHASLSAATYQNRAAWSPFLPQ